MKTFVLIAFVLTAQFCKAQFKEFDLVKAGVEKNEKYIVYLTALWCKPCMDKFKPIADSFKNYNGYKLIILFDQYSMDDEIASKLKKMVDSNLLYFIPSRYYEASSKVIDINPSKKVIKKLVADYNTVISPKTKAIKEFWFGYAVVNQQSVLVMKEYDKEKLFSEIRNAAK